MGISGPRHMGRYREIASVLARHGFGWLFADLNLHSLLPLGKRLGSAQDANAKTQALHLRLALEELGTTFIKLGQVLSTRPDLPPAKTIAELAKLQDEAPSVPFAQPYLQQYWLRRHSPLRMGEKMVDGLVEMVECGFDFPRRLTRLAVQLERGELGATVELHGLEVGLDRTQRMVNQLAASILVGALIVGLSQFMHMVAPEGFLQEYAGRFFGAWFIVAIILGLWLLVSIIRSGGRRQ